MRWSLALILLSTPALAEVPPPSYREALSVAAWHQVNDLIEAGKYEAAIDRAEAIEGQVLQSAGLAYLTGLSYRFLDRARPAERHLKRSIALDPTYSAPWGDLGELYLVQGRYDEARPCYEQVAALEAALPVGPRRLAELSAHQHDAEGFETHIREALRRGFTFRDIAGLPNWRTFYADPTLHDSIDKMVTVYGDPTILETLAPPQTAAE